MLMNQQEAEKKKVQSQEIQSQIEMQTVIITEKQKVVGEDLARVEPAVVDAQQGIPDQVILFINTHFLTVSVLMFILRTPTFLLGILVVKTFLYESYITIDHIKKY